jgi:hypothetical protein
MVSELVQAHGDIGRAHGQRESQQRENRRQPWNGWAAQVQQVWRNQTHAMCCPTLPPGPQLARIERKAETSPSFVFVSVLKDDDGIQVRGDLLHADKNAEKLSKQSTCAVNTRETQPQRLGALDKW